MVGKYTPNTYRHAKTTLRKAKAEYGTARKAYFKDQGSLTLIEREGRLGELIMARHYYRQCLNRVHTIEDTGVELGAAWSPRALANHIARRQAR